MSETYPNLVKRCDLLHDTDGTFWVVSNGSGQILHLDKDYKKIGKIKVPPASGYQIGSPIGIALNQTGSIDPIIIITQDGLILGYNPEIDPNNAIVRVTNLSASYIRVKQVNGFIYATNFTSGFIEKYDQDWLLVLAFTDDNLNDMGYSPYNICGTEERLYVTFAKRTQDESDNGFISTFTLVGEFIERVVNQVPFYAPWTVLSRMISSP